MVKKGKKAIRKDVPSKTLSASPVGQAGQAEDSRLQQAILDIFQNALPVSNVNEVRENIQRVKGYLFNRDFTAAFGSEDFLQAYAMRWSTARALAYTELLTALEVRHQVLTAKVLCVGGGAGAEIVAVSAAAKKLDLPSMTVTVVDSADWASVMNKIHRAIVEAPMLPQYASTARKEANHAFLEASKMTCHFYRLNVLEVDIDLKPLLAGVGLITIMFTLNELFSASMAKATKFLLQLGELADLDTWLLVVDSPGSYSEVSLGQSTPRQYPMHFLLDHVLLAVSQQGRCWKKRQREESEWFRVSAGVRYPLELENTRYQIHLYQLVRNEEL